MLGEDDELARLVGARVDEVVLQDSAQLDPLAVGVEVADAAGDVDEPVEVGQLGVELLDRTGGGGRVQQLLLDAFDLVGAVFVVVPVGRVDGGGFVGDPAAVEQVVAVAGEAFGAAYEGLVNRLGAGGQAPLKHREREAGRVAALVVQARGAVHALADVLGDALVQVLLVLGELVRDGLGYALGEQRAAVERQQVLLDHAAHQPTRVRPVHAGREPALEAVAFEQGEEELEVLLLARVRGGRHQQQVTGAVAQSLAELEPPRLRQPPAEPVRAHPVRLVHDDQVELGVVELGGQGLVAGELVHPRDEQRMLLEHGRAERGVEHRGAQDVEAQAELEEQLVLPLVDQPAGRHDQAAFHVVAEQQLLDVQPGHDGLAGARVVGRQEPQRRSVEHLAVHRPDLVRQRLHVAGGHRQHRVEQPGQ